MVSVDKSRTGLDLEKMDAFWFAYYAQTHPEDIDRTLEHFYSSSGEFMEKVMEYNNQWYRFRNN